MRLQALSLTFLTTVEPGRVFLYHPVRGRAEYYRRIAT